MRVNNAMIRPVNNLQPGFNTRPIERNSPERALTTDAAASSTERAGTAPTTQPPAVALPLGKGEGGPTVKQPTLEGLREAWGTDNPRYDFNEDGIVDVLDLVELLKSMGDNSPGLPETQPSVGSEPTLTDPSGAPAAPVASGEPTVEDPVTLEGLRAAWGTDDPKFDLNSDGIVDVLDLLQLLQQMGKDTPTTHDPINSPTESPELTVSGGDNRPEGGAGAKSITASLIEGLKDVGYDKRPPVNIHALLAQLELTEAQKQTLLGDLVAQYPGGLGVDIVG